MVENKWLSQLRERADQSVFQDVHFTSGLQQGVRDKISGSKRRRPAFTAGVGLIGTLAVSALLFLVLWQAWPQHLGEEQQTTTWQTAAPSTPVRTVETWQPSPSVTETYEGKTYSYIGDRPVRVITDESGIYEAQQQRWVWLLDGDIPAEVEIVGYRSDGKQANLGSYAVGGPLYDARHHFPSGIVLPEPGIWKVHVQAGGKLYGGVYVEVKEGVSPGNQALVEPLVRQYLETEQEELGGLGADRQISLDLLHVDAPNAESRRVYALVEMIGKANGSGLSAPMAFDILYNGNEYKVIGFEMPEDGSNYLSSLERIFPEHVREKLYNRK